MVRTLHHEWVRVGDVWPDINPGVDTVVHIANRDDDLGLDIYWMADDPE